MEIELISAAIALVMAVSMLWLRHAVLTLHWSLFERRLVIFFKDLDRYMDFCLAHYIVWRETRRGKRVARQIGS